ncbi:MAG: hypothetical protein ABIP74_01305 [Candidatus Saccharimonas sp.]
MKRAIVSAIAGLALLISLVGCASAGPNPTPTFPSVNVPTTTWQAPPKLQGVIVRLDDPPDNTQPVIMGVIEDGKTTLVAMSCDSDTPICEILELNDHISYVDNGYSRAANVELIDKNR